MRPSDDVTLRPAEVSDVGAISEFMQAHDQQRSSPEYLRHWYFRNPVPGAVVMLAESGGGVVVGLSTANALRFRRAGEQALVLMPQKVLTAESIRGRGVFGLLYRATEEQALRNGADFFLTVTNAASTPIFLSRFGYARAASPRVLAVPPRPGRTGDRNLAVASQAPPPSDDHSEVPESTWAVDRKAEHYAWRFEDVLDEYMTVQCIRDGQFRGVAHLRVLRRRGIRLLLLLDFAGADAHAVADVVSCVRRVAWRHRCVAVVSLLDGRLGSARRRLPLRVQASSRFNLLVKGRDDRETQRLASEPYGLMLGDLDFV